MWIRVEGPCSPQEETGRGKETAAVGGGGGLLGEDESLPLIAISIIHILILHLGINMGTLINILFYDR